MYVPNTDFSDSFYLQGEHLSFSKSEVHKPYRLSYHQK